MEWDDNHHQLGQTVPRSVVGAMLDGAGEKDGSEGRGVIGEATLTRGVETLSGTFKATVRHRAHSSSYGF